MKTSLIGPVRPPKTPRADARSISKLARMGASRRQFFNSPQRQCDATERSWVCQAVGAKHTTLIEPPTR